jgi:hypothetical protein
MAGPAAVSAAGTVPGAFWDDVAAVVLRVLGFQSRVDAVDDGEGAEASVVTWPPEKVSAEAGEMMEANWPICEQNTPKTRTASGTRQRFER